MSKAKVLIAGGREIFREGLTTFLKKSNEVELVSVCSTGTETIQQVIKLRPNVILLDDNIIDFSCTELVRRIRELQPEVRIVYINQTADKYVDPLSILQVEADGYVDGDIEVVHLIDTIKRVYDGHHSVSPVLGERLLDKFAPSDKWLNSRQAVGLSNRERQVLELVGDGLTNREIARTLFLSENTVKTHVSSILKKMKLRNRQQAAVLAKLRRWPTKL